MYKEVYLAFCNLLWKQDRHQQMAESHSTYMDYNTAHLATIFKLLWTFCVFHHSIQESNTHLICKVQAHLALQISNIPEQPLSLRVANGSLSMFMTAAACQLALFLGLPCFSFCLYSQEHMKQKSGENRQDQVSFFMGMTSLKYTS